MGYLTNLLCGTGESHTLPRWFRLAAGSVLLAVGAENWLGAREWNRYLDEAAAAGEKIDASAVAPPEVLDDTNFAAIPLFQPLFDYHRSAPPGGKTAETVVWRNPAEKDRLTKLGPVGQTEVKGGGWRKGLQIDLAQWQERLRTAGLAGPRSDANHGDDLLHALAEHETDMNVLGDAAARPHSRFPVRYEEHFPVEYPHLSVIGKYTFIARTRALANLSLGRPERAAADTALALRLANSIHREPHIISHTMQIALFTYAMQPLWEGLARHQWKDAQLAALDAAVARFDFLESYACAVRGERSLLSIPAINLLRQDRDQLGVLANQPNKPGTMLIVRTASRILPSGTFDFNKAYLARYYDRLLKTVRPAEHRVFIEDTNKLEQEFREDIRKDTTNPRKTLVGLLFIAITEPLQVTAETQTMVDLTRIAIALERYSIRHGRLPADLAPLTPAFLEKIPTDVVSGNPVIYRLHENGTYDLYGVGWNGRDDGGIGKVRNDDGSDDSNRDDWVWPRPRRNRN